MKIRWLMIITSTNDRETNYKLQYIMTAPNIPADEYDEMSKRKKRGETTTEENATCDRYSLQIALAMHELDADILVKCIYDTLIGLSNMKYNVLYCFCLKKLEKVFSST